MGVKGWYAGARATAAVIVCMGTVLVTAGAAEGLTPVRAPSQVAGGPNTPKPLPQFDDQGKQVTFTIPAPSCFAARPNCLWVLYVNEPQAPGHPAGTMVAGATGQLTLSYPAAYCGTIQADALIGPAPWKYVSGLRHSVLGCLPTSTTTTTSAPPVVSGSTQTPKGTSALPFSGNSDPTSTTAPAHVVSAVAQLPFTGIDVKSLVMLGSLLILVGSLLLLTVESRRRAFAHATAVTLGQVRIGSRKTGSWISRQ